MILSTRESPEMRRQLLNLGVSQMSAGSKTEVGSYHKGDVDAETRITQQFQSVSDTSSGKQMDEQRSATGQFELLDERSVDEVVKDLMQMGFLPSWCTACYRLGRTGEAFMKIAKKGDIQNFCHPNSLLTLQGTPSLIVCFTLEMRQLTSFSLTRVLEGLCLRGHAPAWPEDDRARAGDRFCRSQASSGQEAQEDRCGRARLVPLNTTPYIVSFCLKKELRIQA